MRVFTSLHEANAARQKLWGGDKQDGMYRAVELGVGVRHYGDRHLSLQTLRDPMKPKRLYLDMDGVLMDYEGGIMAHGVTCYKEGAHWISKPRDQWPPEMIAADSAYVGCMELPTFWPSLKPMDDALILWDYCLDYNPHILTAAPSDRTGETRFAAIRERIAQQKRDSIREHFHPSFPLEDIHVCLRHEKAKFAMADAVLVDDTLGNCEEWRAAGGIAIHHKNAYDTIRQLKELGL